MEVTQVFINPDTVSNDSKSVKELARLISILGVQSVTQNDLMAIIEHAYSTMNLMLLRIQSLEEKIAVEYGKMDNPDDESDDPERLGRTGLAILNVSMNSVRISNLELETGTIKKILDRNTSTLEQFMHETGQAFIATANLNSIIINDIVGLNQRLQNLETFAVDTLQDKFKDTGVSVVTGLLKASAKIALSLVEWIPAAGNVATALGDLAEGLGFAVDAIYTLASSNDAFGYIKASGSNAKLLATYIGQASSIKPDLITTNIAAVSAIGRYVETLNSLKFMAGNPAMVVGKQAILSVYFRPLSFVLENFKGLVSEAVIAITNRFQLQKYSNNIPVHGFVTVVYEITKFDTIPPDNAIRRQIVLSVGQVENGLGEADILTFKDLPDNQVSYIDRIQRYSATTKLWTQIEMLYMTPNAKLSDYETNQRGLTLMETYEVPFSYNLIRNFFDCVFKFERNYNLLTHNCQTVSREIVNWAVAGSLPHFWDPSCAAEALLAEYSNKYQVPTTSAAYPMQPYFTTATNMLTDTGPNPNFLDTIRNITSAEIGNWIQILS